MINRTELTIEEIGIQEKAANLPCGTWFWYNGETFIMINIRKDGYVECFSLISNVVMLIHGNIFVRPYKSIKIIPTLMIE